MALLNENDFSDDDRLFHLVAGVDNFYWQQGHELPKRETSVCQDIMAGFGHLNYSLYGDSTPEILKRIRQCFNRIYDYKTVPSVSSIGIFVFRDVIITYKFPILMGKVGIRPLEHSNLTEGQKLILINEQQNLDAYLDQYADLRDIFNWYFNWSSFDINKIALELLDLAVLNHQAAAAILSGSFDSRAAIQSSIMSCELALKSCIANTFPLSKAEIGRKYNHNLQKILVDLEREKIEIDFLRIKKSVALLPKLVSNRYGEEPVPQNKIGNIVMHSQFLLAEVIRFLTKSSFRDSMEPVFKRTFP